MTLRPAPRWIPPVRRVAGMAAAVIGFLTPVILSVAREAAGGSWSPDERAAAAMTFFNKVTAEFTQRAERLTAEGATAPDISCPFLESAGSADKKDVEDWARFIKAELGESGTTRWIGKGLKELESVRKKLAAAEKPALAAWDRKYPDGRKPVDLPPAAEEFIYDIQVQARNLGVILDNSPSMRKALPAVRAEISRRFSAARFVEVDGCQLEPHSNTWGLHGEWYYATVLEERNPFHPKWYLPSIPQNDIHYHMIQWQRDPLAAIESMIGLMEVDALYWFCDFDDDIQQATVKTIGELVEKHKVRLYVHTVKSNPPGSLSNIIRRSGGKLTRASTDPQKPAPEDTAGLEVQALTPELVTASLNQVVKVTGTIRQVSVHSNQPGPSVYVDLAEAGITVWFPEDAYPSVTSHAVIRAQFPPGRRVEVTGRIRTTPQSNRPILELAALEHIRVLPADEAPPVVISKTGDPAATPDAPAAQGEGPWKMITLNDAEVMTHTDKDVQFEGRVKAVEQVEGGHIRILFEGSSLRIGCTADDRHAVIPVSGVRPGDVISVRGRILDFKGRPAMKLTKTGQLRLSKNTAPPGGVPERYKPINPTDADVASHTDHEVVMEAVVKSVERAAPGNLLKIHLEGTALCALCRAEKFGTLFPGVNPAEDVRPGDRVRVKGRITRVRNAPQILLEARDQFLTLRRAPGPEVPNSGAGAKRTPPAATTGARQQ